MRYLLAFALIYLLYNVALFVGVTPANETQTKWMADTASMSPLLTPYYEKVSASRYISRRDYEVMRALMRDFPDAAPPPLDAVVSAAAPCMGGYLWEVRRETGVEVMGVVIENGLPVECPGP